MTYTLYDTDGNTLYATTGVYEPGSNSAAYQSTTYTLYKGNSVTLGSTNITCTATPPSASLPCATINPDGVVTQLAYDAAGDPGFYLDPGRQRHPGRRDHQPLQRRRGTDQPGCPIPIQLG